MTTITYVDLFERAARLAGDRIALVDDSSQLSYAEVEILTSRFANALAAAGFVPGTRFAILSPNTAMALVSQIAGQRAGGAWANINLRNALATNVDVLRRGRCEAVFFHSSCVGMISEIKLGVPSLRFAICVDRDMDGFPSIETFVQGAAYTPGNVHLAPTDIAFLGATGGTTGLPKITQSGQAFLSMTALGFMTAMSFDQPPVNLVVAPITHAGGLVALATLAMGGSVIMMATADLDLLLDNIQRHRVSLLFLPPTLIHMLLDHPRRHEIDFSSLRYLLSSTASLSVDKLIRAQALFGPVICQCYAQTECGMPLTFMSPAEVNDAIDRPDRSHRLKSVGRQTAILSSLEILGETGALLPSGEIGEIVIRAPMVMFAYVDDVEGSREIQRSGWQHTGDLGYRDTDGYIYVTDRKRDLIITGGFNVFPLEVEEVLSSHPAVRECAVIGVPDPKWGEAVKGVVQLAPGARVDERELIEFCKTALGGVKAPKSIAFVEELPRSAVGKILKRELRLHYAG